MTQAIHTEHRRDARALLPLLWIVVSFVVAVGWAGGARAQVDVALRRMPAIPPGTVIGDQPPEGWSHLILKSHPRVAPQSAKDVSDLTARMMSLVCTVILADVQANRQVQPEAPYFLSGLATGLATKIRGQDTIVSSESYARLGANFGFIEAAVLSGAEGQLAKMRVPGRSRTMALIDAEGVLLDEGKHVVVLVRYAVMVEPRTGLLETLVWMLKPGTAGGNHALRGESARLLASSLVEDCDLHVDPGQYILGVPTRMAFAMTQAPPGRAELAFPDAVRPLAAQSRFTADSFTRLEQHLRGMVAQAPPTTQ